MAISDLTPQQVSISPEWMDVAHTGPGTLAGRFMRRFWHPVYIAAELPAGRAVPIRIMNEDFTLYRGETGTPHVVAFRCAHRGTQLSTGWVEGDHLRCFYHGWMYDGSGQCVEQPAEPEPFCQRIKIRGYPTEEYLGLIFAYLGDEVEAPPLPRYPDFEVDGIHEANRYEMRCNFFNALDNDSSHRFFVHRAPGSDWREWDGEVPILWSEENSWGRVTYCRCPDGQLNVNHRGMPNLVIRKSDFEGSGKPGDPTRMDFLEWKVPIDDEHHWNVHKVVVHMDGDAAQAWQARRAAEIGRRDLDPGDLADRVLAGTLWMDEVDPRRTRLTTFQDMVSQAGQGRVANRTEEHPGRTDVGVLQWRNIWYRELRALAEGRPLTQWVRPDDLVYGEERA